jgi:alpha-beta hydrolase superfamily lysophospholipase
MQRLLATVTALLMLSGCGGPELTRWHTVDLTEEFGTERIDEIDSFDAYLELEDKLFAQLDREVYAHTGVGPEHTLNRYSAGSAADPRKYQPNWNRSIELNAQHPVGGVLLLHGMSDSPYSLRSLGETLHRKGFQVIALRLPGHGTAPSGLTDVSWPDMAAAVAVAMAHLSRRVGDKPTHIIGYSTGAPLALNFALDAGQKNSTSMPSSLVLISPAIGVSPAAGLATWKRWLSLVPGLQRLAWLNIDPEFDPYKYNSFATNAAVQVHRLTRSVATRIAARASSEQQTALPPILVLKSTVDATVSTGAVIDRLLRKLPPNLNELVLFDINRRGLLSPLLINDPGALTNRLMTDETLPFGLSVVGNDNPNSMAVSVRYKAPFSAVVSAEEQINLQWPRGVISLSHVALPFSPQDILYGQYPPASEDQLYLGQIPLQGERGLLKISSDWLLRLRYNPFYSYLERRTLDWLNRYQAEDAI